MFITFYLFYRDVMYSFRFFLLCINVCVAPCFYEHQCWVWTVSCETLLLQSFIVCLKTLLFPNVLWLCSRVSLGVKLHVSLLCWTLCRGVLPYFTFFFRQLNVAYILNDKFFAIFLIAECAMGRYLIGLCKCYLFDVF